MQRANTERRIACVRPDKPLRSPNVLSEMKQRLVRLFLPYGKEKRVLRGPARGMRFIVERELVSVMPLVLPTHFGRWIKPGMTIYDVGANKGQMVLLFASLVGPAGRVVAFEPAPIEFSSLVRNIDLNKLRWVKPVKAAVADTEGKLLPVDSTYVKNTWRQFLVSTILLDDVLTQEPLPDVIKIDVEGGAGSCSEGPNESWTRLAGTFTWNCTTRGAVRS